ncbi:MAG: hypothetical protein GPJ54_06255 [Candidatus Heimdallarchaeota archaeon]|nr:hypothetical protein [Candidatus Heimdallarchaeota archaeon]
MNTLTNNGFFIAHFSNNLIYQKINTLDGNLVNGKPVAYYNHSSGLTISGNYGQILLVDVTNSAVKSNDIYNASVGVFLSHSSEITISNNNLENNTEGVGIYYSNNNTIHNNTIWGSSHEGINVVTSTNTSILKNDIYLNKNGISGFEADFIDISKNLIHDNLDNGLHLDTGTNTTILNNLIYKNGFNSSSVIVQTENVDRSLGLNFISGAIFKFNQSIFTIFMTNLFIAYNTIAGNLGFGLYLQYGFGGDIKEDDVMSNDFIDNNKDLLNPDEPQAHIYTTGSSILTANYFSDAAKMDTDVNNDGLLDNPTKAVFSSGTGTTIDVPSLAAPVKNHHYLSDPRAQVVIDYDNEAGSSLIINYGGAVDTLGHPVEYTLLFSDDNGKLRENIVDLSGDTVTVPIGDLGASVIHLSVVAESDLISFTIIEIDLSEIIKNPSNTNPISTDPVSTIDIGEGSSLFTPTPTFTSTPGLSDILQPEDNDDGSSGFLFSPWDFASILGFGALIVIIRRRKLFD